MVSSVNTDYRIRVRVFVDIWNFQLTVNGLATEFRIDWRKLGPVVAEESLMVVDSTASMTYQGMNVYGSHDSASERDQSLRNWAMNTCHRGCPRARRPYLCGPSLACGCWRCLPYFHNRETSQRHTCAQCLHDARIACPLPTSKPPHNRQEAVT